MHCVSFGCFECAMGLDLNDCGVGGVWETCRGAVIPVCVFFVCCRFALSNRTATLLVGCNLIEGVRCLDVHAF